MDRGAELPPDCARVPGLGSPICSSVGTSTKLDKLDTCDEKYWRTADKRSGSSNFLTCLSAFAFSASSFFNAPDRSRLTRWKAESSVFLL